MIFVSPPSLITRVCVCGAGRRNGHLFHFGSAIPSNIRIATMEYPSYSIPRHPRSLIPKSPSSTPVLNSCPHCPRPHKPPQPKSLRSRSLGSKVSQSNKEPLHCFHIPPLPSSGNTRYLPLVDASATVRRTIAQPETQVSVASERSRLR